MLSMQQPIPIVLPPPGAKYRVERRNHAPVYASDLAQIGRIIGVDGSTVCRWANKRKLKSWFTICSRHQVAPLCAVYKIGSDVQPV